MNYMLKELLLGYNIYYELLIQEQNFYRDLVTFENMVHNEFTWVAQENFHL